MKQTSIEELFEEYEKWVAEDCTTSLGGRIDSLYIEKNKRMPEIIKEITTKIEEQTAKAYGGCKSCFGKGYTTNIDKWTGREYEKETPYYLPCSCNRGEQIVQMTKYIEENVLREVMNKLLKKARQTDYVDRTEYDVAYDFIKTLWKE